MRIPDFTTSNSLITRLQQLNTKQSTLQTQLSSQQRITVASDDPAGMNRVMELAAEKQQLQQYARNSAQATDISTASYAGVNQLKTISDRAGELAVLGSDGTSTASMPAYSAELNQLIEQGLQTANTQYAGQHLFGGTATDSAPFTATRDASGNITGVTYNGSTSSPQFRVSDGAPVSPYTSGTSNQDMATFLNNLVALRNGLSSGDANAVSAARPALETSENNLLVTISDIGATQTRLQVSSDQNNARFDQLTTLSGQETDVDVASTTVQFSRAQASYEAALKTGAQVLQTSLLDYIR